jgi:acyl-CoA synthetase (NDP forming)
MPSVVDRLKPVLDPKVVVVVGDKKLGGYMWTNNMLPVKELGGELYSVQIDPNEIPGIEELGVKNFTSMDDVPVVPDYVLVAVPRKVAPFVLADCLKKGAKGACFFTSGFAETGEDEGVELQAKLKEMAAGTDFCLIGPNCMGLYVPGRGVRFSTDLPYGTSGKVGFMSQSGTHAINFSNVAAVNGILVSRTISFGNAILLDVTDYLEYLIQDPQTEVIGMYVEGVKDGPRFFRTLREACRQKPVVIWKGGQTAAGGRATMSHTGSLATDHAIWSAMVRQAGAMTADTLDETVDLMRVLMQAKRPIGKRVALMAMTGGQSVVISDAFAKAGLEVPLLSDSSYEQLGSFFNIIGGSYRNPLDMGGTIALDQGYFPRLLQIMEEDPKIDAVMMEISASFMSRRWKEKPETLDRMLDTLKEFKERSAKPLLTILHPAHVEADVAAFKPRFTERDLPVFPSFERAAEAFAKAVRHFST